VKQLDTKRKKALEEIEWTAQLLKDTRSSARYSLNRLNLLSEQVQARQQVVNLLNEELSLMDKDIADMNITVGVLEQDLTYIRSRYAKSLQNMHARHSIQYKWFFILSADNFSQSVRRMRYLREYSDWQKRQASLIVGKQAEISLKQTEMAQVRVEKQALLEIQAKERTQLQAEEAEQKIEVQQLTQKQKELQAELTRKKKEAEALDRQIENLIGKEMNRSFSKKPASQGTEIASEPATKTGTTSGAKAESGYHMTKEAVKLSGDFASNRGRLPYPLTGKYKIVVPFGEHQHPTLKHVRTNNNGIDIQTTAGAEAQAVFKGEVTAVFTEEGYNRGVIVRHGKYLTVYVNLSEVYVKSGDKVSTHQKLGKIFTDANRTTILHFEVRKEKEKLNPKGWLH
jgi:septal ring factor EnvC (AmiA/AmiB activator)